jgi:hypothetical protein
MAATSRRYRSTARGTESTRLYGDAATGIGLRDILQGEFLRGAGTEGFELVMLATHARRAGTVRGGAISLYARVNMAVGHLVLEVIHH